MPRQSAISILNSSGGKFEELRGLLLGPEREDIRELKQRLASPRLAEDISRALPQAVRAASQRDRDLRSALQPVIEQGLRASIRSDSGILIDTLAPIIGEAVKKAVASALRQLSQAVQQTLEQSFSLRGLTWRFEGFRTGRPYGEIVLVRSLLYRVDQVFLIHRETGLLLLDSFAESSITKDGDLVSAMLTAVQDFVKDSLGQRAGETVEAIEAGEFVIWISQSAQVILAALIRGAPPKALKTTFESVLQTICSAQSDALARFNGDTGPFQVCKKDVERCFLGQGRRAKRRIVWWPAIAAAICIAALVGGFFYLQMRARWRWQELLGTFRREPGIVLIESSMRNGKYFVSGLRDPLARNPTVLIREAGFHPGEVNSEWHDYLTTQQPFAALRDFDEAKKRVESRRIYFSLNSAQLPTEQADNLGDLAASINPMLESAVHAGKNIKIEITGHTDVSGSEARNAKLSEARAQAVIAFLTSTGSPSQAFSTQGATTSMRAVTDTATSSRDGNDWTRIFSRAVSLRVVPAQP